MFKIKVANINGELFEGVFKSTEECLAWTRRKKQWHGDIDAGTATYSIENIDSEIRIKQLWEDANGFLNSQMDANSRDSISLLLADPATTDEQKQKIVAYGNWLKNLWKEYAIKKAMILQGENVKFDQQVVGNTPHTIWEISA